MVLKMGGGNRLGNTGTPIKAPMRARKRAHLYSSAHMGRPLHAHAPEISLRE